MSHSEMSVPVRPSPAWYAFQVLGFGFLGWVSGSGVGFRILGLGYGV